MKVLLVNGSPKERGCTYTALSVIATVLEENGIQTEFFQLGTMPVRGCIACRKCKTTPLDRCLFSDDVANALIECAKEADGFIIGSPVYYASINGALSAVLDRAFFAGGMYFKGKPAAGVAVARRSGTTAAIDALNKYFTISNMPVISSHYWNNVFGMTPDAIRKDEEGLSTLRVLAKGMAEYLKR